MAQDAVNVYERAQPEALKVAVLDRDHLARMTFGDRSLEREVLQLFDRQSELLLERMRASEPAAIATLELLAQARNFILDLQLLFFEPGYLYIVRARSAILRLESRLESMMFRLQRFDPILQAHGICLPGFTRLSQLE